MDILIELSRALTKNKTKSIRVIDHFDKPVTKLEHFFEGLRSGQITNDNEAIKCLYGSLFTKKDKNKYYKLKFDLREKLINTIFFIDSNTNLQSKKELKELELRKLLSAYYSARKIDAPNTKIWLLKRVIKIGIEYDLFTPVRDAAYLQCLDQSFLGINIKKNENYHIYLDYAERLDLSNKLEILFFDVQEKTTKKYSPEAILQTIEEGLASIEILPIEKRSYNYSRYFTYLNIIKHDTQSNFRKCESISLDFIKTSKRYTYVKNFIDIPLLISLIETEIQLSKIDEGLHYCELLLKQVSNASTTYYFTNRMIIILLLKSNKLDEAMDIYNTVNPKIPSTKNHHKRREYWQVMDGWLKWLKSIQEYNKSRIAVNNDFKIYKLLNNIPTTAKDKKGLNINVLILEIAYLFLRKDYNKLIDKIEILHRYRLRYFDKKKNLRTHLFIDILVAFYKNNFKIKGLKKEVISKIESIQTMLLTDSNQYFILEIVPYEIIWDEIMTYIENK